MELTGVTSSVVVLRHEIEEFISVRSSLTLDDTVFDEPISLETKESVRNSNSRCDGARKVNLRGKSQTKCRRYARKHRCKES